MKLSLNKSSIKFGVVCLIFMMLLQNAKADLMYSWTGTSTAGQSVTVNADLTIDGDELTIVLSNTSSEISQAPDDLLTSFYFDIEGRPDLTYTSASGNVFLNNNPQSGNPADLIADSKFDGTWQFKSFTNPDYGYGIGTVGNNSLGDEGLSFNGSIVGNLNYGISTATVGGNLLDDLLVSPSATFTFGGMAGYGYDDIINWGMGLGTAPDIFVPLPATILLGILGLGVGSWKLRKSI